MLRALFWLVVYLATLGLLDIEVKYDDGLTVRFKSWVTLLRERNR